VLVAGEGALGDVQQDAGQAQRRPRGVAVHVPAGQEPAFAVGGGGALPELHLERAGAREGRPDRLLDPVAVVRVDQVDDRVATVGVAQRDAAHRAALRCGGPDHLVGGHQPGPQGHPGGVQGELPLVAPPGLPGLPGLPVRLVRLGLLGLLGSAVELEQEPDDATALGHRRQLDAQRRGQVEVLEAAADERRPRGAQQLGEAGGALEDDAVGVEQGRRVPGAVEELARPGAGPLRSVAVAVLPADLTPGAHVPSSLGDASVRMVSTSPVTR